MLRAAIFMIALAGAVLLLGTALSQFTVRTFADPRLTFSRAALRAAVAKYPNSPRMHLRLAEAELTGDEAPAPAATQMQAELAAALSPFDFHPRQLLAIAQEANGDAASAKQSWSAAATLAPANSQVNWARANLLLREGETQMAVEPLRAVAKYNKQLLPAIFDALWRTTNQNVTILRAVTDGEPEAQQALARFLSQQQRAEDAVTVFK